MYISKMKVKEAMVRQGIQTQTQLAKILGITKNQLSLMLSDKFDPIKSNTTHLCGLLGVSPLDILSPSDTHLDSQSAMIASRECSATQTNTVKAIELFAGAGGLALGLEQAGIETVAHVEIDKYCCETLRKNRPMWHVIEGDVCQVNFTPFCGKIHVVTGGFPCQAFSYAGKKLGFEDTRGTMFYEFARCVKEVQPMLFMAENVRGLISHDQGRTLTTIVDILSGLGYQVQYKLLNAVDYGVAQKRERIVIIGVRSGMKFTYPEKEKKIAILRDVLEGVPPSVGQQYSVSKKKVLSLVPPGGCWRHLPLEIQKSYMGKSFFSGGGRTGMARRIAWDEPCLTLTCSPSQKQTERCHPDEVRPFTVREYARIQSFPDDWEFYGGIGDRYKQIGNAVPVKLARKLGERIVQAIQSGHVSC